MKAATRTRLARLEANLADSAAICYTIPIQLIEDYGTSAARVVKTIPARPMAIGERFDYRTAIAELEL